MTEAIRCRGLGVSFNGTQAVDGVDLSVAAGEWVALIGPNGSGKTSLLRAVAGTVETTGVVELLGRNTASLGRRQMARTLAVVPQHPVTPPGMTVLEYVLLGRTPHLRYLGVEGVRDFRVVDTVLEDLDLTGMAGRALTSLSGGELQRVVLARALAQEAPVLLLDEPTTALDVGHQQQVLELVDRLRKRSGIAVLAAMHDLTLAGQYADRLVLLAGGRVAASGGGRQVLTAGVLRRYYEAEVTILEGPQGVPVVVPLKAGPESGGLASGNDQTPA
jgi:iron complex transport system ATP-binding protein